MAVIGATTQIAQRPRSVACLHSPTDQQCIRLWYLKGVSPAESSAPAAWSKSDQSAARSAIETGESCVKIGARLNELGADSGSAGLRVLSVAFLYALVDQEETDRRAAVGGPYAPGYVQATALTDVPAPVRELWRAARADLDDLAVADARLSDVLYVAEGRGAHADGRRAAAAMTLLTEDTSRPSSERAAHAARALEILTELSDVEALRQTAARFIAVVDGMFASEELPPAPAALRIVRALIALKPRDRPSSVGDLLRRVVDAYAGTPAEDRALALAISATPSGPERDALAERQLRLRIDAAEAAEGFMRVDLLQKAIELPARTD